jgi:bifunctional DNA primase/polymerase-like protein
MSCPDTIARLAARGFRLFPLAPRSKIPPKDFSWPELATANVAQLDAWAEQFPGCNWALKTGRDSGVFALDIDIPGNGHGDADGRLWFGEMVAQHDCEWTNTLCQRTGGGGTQLFFKMPAGVLITNSSGKIAPGVDIKGEGGYVVVAPSIHPDTGKPYEFLSDLDQQILAAPDWPLAKSMTARSKGNTPLQPDAKPIVHPRRYPTLLSLAFVGQQAV